MKFTSIFLTLLIGSGDLLGLKEKSNQISEIKRKHAKQQRQGKKLKPKINIYTCNFYHFNIVYLCNQFRVSHNFQYHRLIVQCRTWINVGKSYLLTDPGQLI